MADLIEHAREELKRAGEDPQTAQAILDVIEMFVAGGLTNDGTTHAIATTYVEHLLRRRPLTPLTTDPAEWEELTNPQGYTIWQSKRNPVAFSDDGGKKYWLLTDLQPPIVDERVMYDSADPATLVRPPNIQESVEKMADHGQDEEIV
jgi:hypothetical protein